MKNDVIQYERTYQRLKNKIERGIFPVGSKLPSRAVLCKHMETSERTIRKALELLEKDGFVETAPRKRATVISAFVTAKGRSMQNTREASSAQVNDLMQTSYLLCYPIYMRGLHMCKGKDWDTPEAIFSNMQPSRAEEFWQLSSMLWRFFITRNENELLLRVVDSLGFRGKEPPHSTIESRREYLSHTEKLLNAVKNGSEPGQVQLDAIFSQYMSIAEQAEDMQFFKLCSPCPMLAEADGLLQQLSFAQERYSSVCLDLLGVISIGRYQPGDRLPTHDQLQEHYKISRDTSVKAVRMLQDWGVVTTAPRRGISVAMDLDALKEIQIPPQSISRHVRRYLDSLDLLSLTVRNVSAHAAEHVDSKSAKQLKSTIFCQLEKPYEHQFIPRTLLNFITEHIQYDSLRAVYEFLTRNLSVGRSIPKLVSREKNGVNCAIYEQCIETADMLMHGNTKELAAATENIFLQVQKLVISECRRLGYLEAAMKVYDGSSLWK